MIRYGLVSVGAGKQAENYHIFAVESNHKYKCTHESNVNMANNSYEVNDMASGNIIVIV